VGTLMKVVIGVFRLRQETMKDMVGVVLRCENSLSSESTLRLKVLKERGEIIIIIIMQRLTRHVSVIRLTNRRRGVTWIYG